MSGAPTNKTASRTAIVALFAVCGGAVGGALISFAAVLFQPSALIQPGALESLLLLLITAAGWGSLIGFVPALVTGLIYAFLPDALQKIVVAPLLGGGISAGYGVFFARITQDEIFYLPGAVWYTIAGVGAAFVCAIVARTFHIDASGKKLN